ncbi:2-methylcitrate synthase [Mycobacterium persicum]|uniref:citrate synthase (unknown stereospecificity) n=2 Tax=Mycobacterium persicum TaxID=1487726 RepID=A0AB38UPX2_9MYCO|nr:2-methylcitrate synthase [Mycobacterium persicum]VAZ82593.1 2-methylcitrate synthase [Mycobacterium persicum]VAZ89769.1 2-methylcitrate synthase [Mycobacterium persicum]
MRDMFEIGAAARTSEWSTSKLARNEKIVGCGHRVYQNGDWRVSARGKP